MADHFFGVTDKGLVRTNNEDTFIAKSIMNDRFIVACVIDGVGGYEGGEVAAKLAYDSILLQLIEIPEDGTTEFLRSCLIAVNAIIYNDKKTTEGIDSMACVLTLALVDIENNKFYYAHVGDTRLYLMRDGSLIKVSNDHSFVGFLEDKGKISEEDAMKHPKRNEINKALGFEADVNVGNYIDTGDSPFLPGDLLMICSDGLSDMIDKKGMASILTKESSLVKKTSELIDAANDAGGNDNITVVLVKNEKIPLQHEATKPIKTIAENADEIKKNQSLEIEITEKEKKKNPLPIFIFLIFILLCALSWLIYLNYKKSIDGKRITDSTSIKRSAKEQMLVDSIYDSKTNEVFILNQAGDVPLIITDSLFINRDSLRIIGNGATLLCASAYKGSAITLSTQCKYILLDSLTLENFDIGVIARSPVLYFHNVHFKNCKVPIQYNFLFQNKPIINGNIADSVFYNADIKPNHQ